MGVVSQQPLGHGLGPSDQTPGGGLQGAGAWTETVGHDPVNSYFECITSCSVDDGECVTRCVEVLREGD